MRFDVQIGLLGLKNLTRTVMSVQTILVALLKSRVSTYAR